MTLLALLAQAWCGACGDPDEGGLVCEAVAAGTSRMLVDHDAWRLATAAEDPWAAHRPGDDISCPERSRQPEDFAGIYAYGVITTECPYTTLVQASVAQACRGETLYVWLWNYALTGPEGATAHLAVQIGDDVMWEKAYPIPGPAGLVTERIELARDVPIGTPIYFHVRNHGNNSYELLEVSIVDPDPEDAPAP
ncbi:MAG: hypothetical protein IT385_28310 [Deltaproteobacteria bacterium]|nr:hypothetical protein [Deltaproteobacteria bacterium]